jgi:hypothetical protein
MELCIYALTIYIKYEELKKIRQNLRTHISPRLTTPKTTLARSCLTRKGLEPHKATDPTCPTFLNLVAQGPSKGKEVEVSMAER